MGAPNAKSEITQHTTEGTKPQQRTKSQPISFLAKDPKRLQNFEKLFDPPNQSTSAVSLRTSK